MAAKINAKDVAAQIAKFRDDQRIRITARSEGRVIEQLDCFPVFWLTKSNGPSANLRQIVREADSVEVVAI